VHAILVILARAAKEDSLRGAKDYRRIAAMLQVLVSRPSARGYIRSFFHLRATRTAAALGSRHSVDQLSLAIYCTSWTFFGSSRARLAPPL